MLGGYGIHQFGFGVFRKQIKRTASYVSASFPAYFLASQNADYNSFRAIVDDYLPEGATALTATSEDWETAYAAYVTDVQTELGTTQVGSGGFYVWFTSNVCSAGSWGGSLYSYTLGTTTTVNFRSTGETGHYSAYVVFIPYEVVVDGYYSLVYVEECNLTMSSPFVDRTNFDLFIFDRTPKDVGSRITNNFNDNGSVDIIVNERNTDGVYRLKVGAYVEPTTYAINDFTTSVGGGAGRLGNVPITFATMDEEENLTPVENTYIVNEGDNEYYDIVNNVTYDMSRFTYDYSTRTYEVTYIDNDSVTQTTNVTYGDEYITVVQGGNTYNYYYAISA